MFKMVNLIKIVQINFNAQVEKNIIYIFWLNNQLGLELMFKHWDRK
jgi:hypothetical protein